MHTELKRAIINFIFENYKEFQIIKRTKEEFRPFIYDSKGDCLIGGDEVSCFIDKAIKLIINP